MEASEEGLNSKRHRMWSRPSPAVEAHTFQPSGSRVPQGSDRQGLRVPRRCVACLASARRGRGLTRPGRGNRVWGMVHGVFLAGKPVRQRAAGGGGQRTELPNRRRILGSASDVLPWPGLAGPVCLPLPPACLSARWRGRRRLEVRAARSTRRDAGPGVRAPSPWDLALSSAR